MEERRQKERIQTDLRILACTPSINPDSRITNMSGTGAFIMTDSPLRVDTEAIIHLQLPGDSEIMEIKTRVVWTKTHSNSTASGMGIHFTEILPEHREKLAAFIENTNK